MMSIVKLFTKLALACLKYDTVTCKKSSIYEYEFNVISFNKSDGIQVAALTLSLIK